jgi:predicted phage tail protein
MSAAVRKSPVRGAKGGEAKQKQPSIASNSTPSIATARIVYIWSWGPIVGPVNGRNSVKLDGTPLVAEDGTENYPGVKWQFRNGELNQTRLDGIAESSNEIDVNQTLLSTTPYLHSINNPVLDGVRIRFGWPQLQSQDQSGNINGVRIDYAIDVQTDSGPFVEVLTSFVDRKNVTKYERSHRINLPAGTRWTIRARRITPEANSSLVQDAMVVEAIAEVVDSDQEFPLTSVGCIEYDAQQFGGDIAKIAILMRGKIVRVPTNYNTETRTYATGGTGTSNGVWDGTFKEAYTNNPAWIFYDLVLDPYYGLGERIDATMIDRWNLYRIGQYCDQMVPDGAGGLEPRYTCNIYLQKQADAYAVLQDLAQAFHGMTTWDGSQITVNADMPGDPVYTYNPSQILNNGEIKYAGTRARDRHNQAMVTWDNPAQGYDTDKEPVFDDQALAESGSVNELSVDAYGCTSRGQAQRAGQWALITEQAQIRGGSFRVGLDGQIPKPGQIIALADPMLAGRANGGRISAVAGRIVTLDREAELPAGGKLRVNLPSGKSEARVISSISGRNVTVAAVYSEVPEAECGWIIEHDDLKTMQFLVRNITRPEWHQFQLDCIQHEPSKFDAIDFGAVIDDRPISGIPIGTQDAPAQVFLSQHVVIEQGIAVTVMTIGWAAASGAVAYDVEWRWGSREWIKVPRTGELSVDVRGIYAGQYLARVRAVSALNVSSLPTTSALTNLDGKVGLPPAVTSLVTESLIFGIGLKWTFPAGAEDTQRTELWSSQTPQLDSAIKLADLAYPQSDYTMQGLKAGQSFFFWARLVDRTGNVGPWFPTAPGFVNGQASSNADDILDYLVGEITESQLGQELLSEIGKIGGDGPGSVNERLDQVRTDLGDQITDVSNTVTEVQNELQAQIDQIADLADSMPYKADQTYTAGQGVLGADGIIYQATQNVPKNTAPPNATYWLNVGQAVQTANGLAARVTTAETKITSIEGVNTAQANQITGLQTSLDGKASSTAVQSLTTRVTTAEGTLSSQGTAITGLNSSLTTTNQNVTAAQNAANAANTLAGGKGKVIVQSAAPAAADQLAQNLWIDITNNANTPKRWTGSKWDAVTDKAATDAAAAAASALAQVATKAEAATVQALNNTVTQQGTDLTAAGNAITNITANISNVGGENLLYNPSFDRFATAGSPIADGWVSTVPAGPSAVFSQVASTLDPSGKSQRIDVSGLTTSTYADLTPVVTNRPAVSAGQVITLSTSVRGTAGLGFQLFMQHRDASGAVLATASQGVNTLTDGWQRISLTSAALPAGTVVTTPLLRVRPNSAGSITAGFAEVDRAQLEVSPVVSGWKDSGKAASADIAAQAAATTALTGRVTQTETGLTSVSGQLTQLTNNIGSMGGDNLLPNSSFEQAASSSTARPLYWNLGGQVAGVPQQVASPLSASTMALRITRTGMVNGNYVDLLFNPSEGLERPKVTAGQSYTLSVYARGSASTMKLAMYIQFMNEAGSVVNTPTLPETALTDSFQRFTLTGICPSGATRAQVYAGRMFNRSGSTVDAWFELDNVQLQEGTTATAYSPSVQAVTTAQAATSAAVDSLSSAVTQQGNTLTSVAARTTTLENAVNSTTDGLATKASAAALQTLSNRVTSAEGVNTAQSSSITDLQTSVSTIQGSLGASGLDPAENATWNFDSTAEGWTANNSTLSFPSAGVMRQTATAGDPSIQVSGLSINGGLFTKVRMSITRRAGAAATDWDGQFFYSTSGHGFTASFRKVLANPNLAIGASTILEFDMAALTAGGADWTSSTITALRVDLGLVSGSAFDIDWIAVGRVGPAASSRALQSLTSTVTTQGATQTSQSQQIVSLQSSVGGNTAQLQQQATTIADSANKIASSYSVRLALSSGGQYYAAGFGLGLDNSSGALQSSFVVSADRFAVLNTVAGNVLTAPFAVVNGQTFISDAFIQDGSITNAKIGEVIQSNNWVPGQTGWAISKTGYFEMNGNTPGAGRIVITSAGVKVYDQNGTLRVQLGNLG